MSAIPQFMRDAGVKSVEFLPYLSLFQLDNDAQQQAFEGKLKDKGLKRGGIEGCWDERQALFEYRCN